MASSKKSQPATIYQIKVTLLGTRPKVWRRIQVDSKATLQKLHDILQIVMGWGGYHLYQFHLEGEYFGEPHTDDEHDMQPAKRVKLSEVYHGPKTKFIYEYDFGDSWEHEILFEKEMPAEPGSHYPVCLEGERACPPEDCGGVWGYEDLLKIIKNPEHEEYEEMMEWVGEDFDPEAFDLNEINRTLKAFR